MMTLFLDVLDISLVVVGVLGDPETENLAL
jgi:hypothetical protein